MGLIACHYRAAEWRHKEIELAARELLQYLDAKGSPGIGGPPRFVAEPATACRTLVVLPRLRGNGGGVADLRVGRVRSPFGFFDWISGEDEEVGVEARSCGAGAAEAEAGVAGELLELSVFRRNTRGSTALTTTAAGVHDRAASATLVIGVSVPR